MAQNTTLNGVTFSIPEPGDTGWGSQLTAFLLAIAPAVLQKTGGLFTLTSDIDFGTAFGVKSLYFETRANNPASTGVLRLANTDLISFRNFANSGNVSLSVNSSDQLLFNGTAVIPPLTSAHIFVGNGSNVATDVAVSGDLTLTNTGNFQIAAGTIVDADVNAAAGIVYSKLNLSNSIINADINTSAAIAFSKLAALSASKVVVTDGSGVIATINDGTNGQFLTTNGSGTYSFATVNSGANTALSNLASVAINTSLLPATNNSIDLGSSSKEWQKLYVVGIKGNAAGTGVAAGDIGEFVTANGAASFPASNVTSDIASISLTAGDWDIAASMLIAPGSSDSLYRIGISTISGNSFTGGGLADGLNTFKCPGAASGSNQSLYVPRYRAQPSVTTTYYFKYNASYSGTAPSTNAYISARRAT